MATSALWIFPPRESSIITSNVKLEQLSLEAGKSSRFCAILTYYLKMLSWQVTLPLSLLTLPQSLLLSVMNFSPFCLQLSLFVHWKEKNVHVIMEIKSGMVLQTR